MEMTDVVLTMHMVNECALCSSISVNDGVSQKSFDLRGKDVDGELRLSAGSN